jgi:hypothetical protein
MTRNRSKLPYSSAILLIALSVSAAAWWRWRCVGLTGSGRADSWLSYLSLALVVPGWLIVTMFDPRETQLANRWTDVFIPLLSGSFWALLTLLATKVLTFFRKHVH